MSDEQVVYSSPRRHASGAQALSTTRPQAVLECVGHWSNCDVWCSVPAAWAAPDTTVNLYGIEQGTRQLLESWTIAGSPTLAAQGQNLVGKLGGVRGAFCDAFLVEVVAGGAQTAKGEFFAATWGDNSTPITYEGKEAYLTGKVVQQSEQRRQLNVLPSARFVSVAPVLANGDSIILRCDVNGVLLTTAAGGAGVIMGSKTPSDAYANPTDALDSWALAGVFNGSTWDRARGGLSYPLSSVTGLQNVVIEAVNGPFSADAARGGGQYGPLECDSRGAVYFVGGNPPPGNSVLPANFTLDARSFAMLFGSNSTSSYDPWMASRVGPLVGTTPGIGLVTPTGMFNSALPVLLNGQYGTFQLDAASCQIISPVIVKSNVTAAGQTLATMAGQAVAASSISVALASSGMAATLDTDAGTVYTKNLKNSSGDLFMLMCAIVGTVVGQRFLLVVNKATAAVNGDVPALPPLLMSTSSLNVYSEADLTTRGLNLATGVTWCISTTAAAVTLPVDAQSNYFTSALFK